MPRYADKIGNYAIYINYYIIIILRSLVIKAEHVTV